MGNTGNLGDVGLFDMMSTGNMGEMGNTGNSGKYNSGKNNFPGRFPVSHAQQRLLTIKVTSHTPLTPNGVGG